MTPEEADKRLREKIEKAFVPADLCTTDPAAIESLLDTTNAEPFPEEKLQRMLNKLKDKASINNREEEEEDEEQPVWIEGEMTQEEKELVALHRQGKVDELSPENKEKLRKIREKARLESQEGEAGDD